MNVYISMLRGVNVGGHNKVKMEALKALYESLGLKHAQTLIQSGNVVFQTKEQEPELLARQIGDGIEKTFKFRPSVIVRTTSEMRDVIMKNPFAGRKQIEPGKLLVTFLVADPGSEARKQVLALKTDPEELRVKGSELYIYFPNGIGKSKLPMAKVEKTLKTSGTGRNWNTVQKLLAMAEALEAVS
jgi:uncharacterized protein (DUF1697 family)